MESHPSGDIPNLETEIRNRFQSSRPLEKRRDIPRWDVGNREGKEGERSSHLFPTDWIEMIVDASFPPGPGIGTGQG